MAELQFSIDAEAFKKAVADVFKKEGKKYAVPGFRKGKAPRALIEKMYGADVFTYDAINELFPEAFEAAVKEAGVEPVGRPEVTVDSADETNGVTLTVKVAVKPEVKVGSYNGLTVEKTVHTVSDEAVEAELKRVQERNARELTREGAAENGDIADIDFEGFVDGVAFEGGKAEHYNLTLGSGSFIPGFEDQLVGLKAGDEKDVVVTFPENYTKELAGKEATFKCKIHEVKETIKPELDDEFAKDVSEFDTLAALKKSIKADLAAKRQEAVDREFENEAVVLAGKNMTCNIPACMIDEQVDKHLEQFAYQLQSQGMKMDDYLKMIGGDVKGMRDSMRPMAEQTVRSNILLSEIVHQENLDVTEEEVEEELKKMAEQYKMELDKIKEMIDVEAVKSDLKGRKAVKLIVDNAKPVEKEKKTAKKAAKKEDAAEAPAEEAKTEE
mgnify:CR=1 FL=1